MSNKPFVVVMTLHRRYREFSYALDIINKNIKSLDRETSVVVVYVDPEESATEILQELRSKGFINYILTRPKLDKEGQIGGTTYPESHNIRMGLDFVRTNSATELATVMVMAGDVWPKESLWPKLKSVIDNDEPMPFLLDYGSNNPILKDRCVNTSLFCVSTDPTMWPPVSAPENVNILEAQWFIKLKTLGLLMQPLRYEDYVYNSHDFDNQQDIIKQNNLQPISDKLLEDTLNPNPKEAEADSKDYPINKRLFPHLATFPWAQMGIEVTDLHHSMRFQKQGVAVEFAYRDLLIMGLQTVYKMFEVLN